MATINNFEDYKKNLQNLEKKLQNSCKWIYNYCCCWIDNLCKVGNELTNDIQVAISWLEHHMVIACTILSFLHNGVFVTRLVV